LFLALLDYSTLSTLIITLSVPEILMANWNKCHTSILNAQLLKFSLFLYKKSEYISI